MKAIAVSLVVVIITFALPAPAGADGGELFARKCSTCHGKDGKGDTAMGKKKGIRSLGSPEVQAQTDNELALMIAEGGRKKDKSHAFKAQGLSDEDVRELVTFIRALKRR